jgi:hypothetical protein
LRGDRAGRWRWRRLQAGAPLLRSRPRCAACTWTSMAPCLGLTRRC